MNWKNFTRVLMPFVLVCLMQFFTYWGNQWYAEANGVVGIDLSVIFPNFNQAVPFWSYSIYPYVLSYPFWVFTFFYVGYRSKHNMYLLVSLVLVTFTVCGLVYFFYQTDVEMWRVSSGLFSIQDPNFTERLVLKIYASAGPRNAMPSMHCLMSWLCIIGARIDKKMPLPAKIFIWVMGITICISTQTLKQHYIIDLITGVALAEAAYWIFRKSSLTGKLESFFTKLNIKMKLE
ncbi:MAG TPA: phosphatase PAP2 family protein [Bacillota bacterium]|nr:phosphatase PAP2 family protein [Bacillota bacterium]HPF42929.1 phosphatase PAP2 family protein [Bacillota bacterium]HPJ85493.1 phosphatase PAP2 family protein [Bacillota bacterium]HPQ62252.1 phosphatase PAP2 family protein [Bacillota bacterium]